MNFAKIKLFCVKPDKLAEFEDIIKQIAKEQQIQTGCTSIKYFKRFFTIDGTGSIENGNPPRELTKIVKCVKYYSYWEFDNRPVLKPKIIFKS